MILLYMGDKAHKTNLPAIFFFFKGFPNAFLL